MKRLFTLFVLMCMAVGIADVAVAQDAPTTKTRYVYLWDVTASTKNKKVGNKSYFDVMADFLREDIARKEGGTEIYVVPFNERSDRGLQVIKFVKGEKPVDEIVQKGEELVADHSEKYGHSIETHGRRFNSGERLGESYYGFTDIAGVLKATQKYVTTEYNTIFILLTDCGQEYVNNTEKVVEGDDKSQDYLCREIDAFNGKMCGIDDKVSFNRLFYVVVDTKDDPREHDPDLNNLKKVKFITPSNGSIMLYFERLGVVAPKKPVSYLDKSIVINFEGISAKSVLRNYNNIVVDVVGVYYDKENVEHKIVREGLKLDIANGIVTIDKVDFKSDASKFDVNTEIEFKVTLAQETEKYYEDIKDKYVRVWLNPNVTTVTVTKDFAPTLRVKKH